MRSSVYCAAVENGYIIHRTQKRWVTSPTLSTLVVDDASKVLRPSTPSCTCTNTGEVYQTGPLCTRHHYNRTSLRIRIQRILCHRNRSTRLLLGRIGYMRRLLRCKKSQSRAFDETLLLLHLLRHEEPSSRDGYRRPTLLREGS